jgi:hypothetical protein
MPIKKMNLRNLLQIFYSTEKYRAKLLRRDVIEQIKKDNGKIGSGQYFYGPFWADAKDHAAGLKDLTIETYNRIEKSERRKNTYPILRDGFLSWWNEKRRWRNERFDIIPQTDSVNANFYEIDCVVKIENMFSVRIDESEKRLIYPYFPNPLTSHWRWQESASP